MPEELLNWLYTCPPNKHRRVWFDPVKIRFMRQEVDVL